MKHKYGNQLLDKAIRKYGLKNFDTLLLENVPEEELDYWETHYIEECHSLSPNGYNLETGGHKNKHLHEETKKKSSESHIGQIPWCTGQTLTEEHKKNLSKGHEEQAKQLRGKPRPPEVRKKISESQKGKIIPEEVRKKISETERGKSWSEARRKAQKKTWSEARRRAQTARKEKSCA